MNATGWSRGLEVTGGGTGVVSHAGLALLRQLSDRTGLTAGLSAAQLVPAGGGARAGLAGGYGLFTAANQGGGASQPPAWWLITALLGTLIAVAGLTAGPARLAARVPIAAALQGTGSGVRA